MRLGNLPRIAKSCAEQVKENVGKCGELLTALGRSPNCERTVPVTPIPNTFDGSDRGTEHNMSRCQLCTLTQSQDTT